MLRALAVMVSALFVLSAFVSADVPRVINYQGVLTDSEGAAVPDGMYEITFRLYSSSTPGSFPIWTETNIVTVNKGIFSVMLGESVPLDLAFTRQYFLGMSVEGEKELTPLVPLAASAYSLNADCVRGSNMMPAKGAVGIGTAAPAETLDVAGGIRIGNSSKTNAGTIRWTGSDFEGYNGSTWQSFTDVGSGSVPTGAAGQTLYHTGSSWAATNNLTNDGTNIGIGTTDPDRLLEVSSNLAYIRLTGTVSAGPTFEMKSTDNSADFRTYGRVNFLNAVDALEGSINYQYRSYNGVSGMYFTSGGASPRMVLSETGEVGINTTSPTARLDLNGGQLRVRHEDSEEDYFEIDNESSSSGSISLVSPQDGKKSLQIRCVHDATGTPFAETWMRFSVGSKFMPTHAMTIRESGYIGIGTDAPSRKLTVRGNILIESESTGDPVAEFGEGLDYAEGFDVSETSAIEPGTVLVIDPDNPGKLTTCSKPYDRKVAGIVAGAEGLGSGVRLGVDQFDCDVALAGRVYCNVDASGGGIEPGDLLTTSGTPGYAMKVDDHGAAQGAILGKAMERLGRGEKGRILVLVTLQ